MIHKIVAYLSGWVIWMITLLGHPGIVLAMAIESACIPLPSEIIMPFSGYLVSQGIFSLWAVSVSGAIGCVLGSVVTYYIGFYGGRPFVEKYGKYVLIHKKDLDRADAWSKKYGDTAVFISRLLPVIRTFISLPAGIMKVNFAKFVIYTFVGSLIWCWFLAWIGLKLGEHWNTLSPYFHKFDLVIGLVIAAGAGYFIYHHLKGGKHREEKQ